ncbi:MAG: type II toxin-antitoxin system Phd/YefM family antitoxin [Verrucomicrobia bacterium]|nr:type II toxin-antitoxin system Phd/YefM family antitoxin [Verrucomicrobiota bacterium]
MIKVPLAEVKDALSDYVKKAAKDEVLITRHGKPAAILIGFADEDDWFDYRLEHDERFLKRIAESRRQAHREAFVRLEELPEK